MCPDGAPIRPSIPPVLGFAVSAWLGVLLAEWLSWRSYIEDYSPCSLLLSLLFALMICCVALRFPRAFLVAVAGLSLGLICGWLYWVSWQSDLASICNGGIRTIRCEAVSDPVAGRFGSHSTVRVGRTYLEVFWPKTTPGAEYGSEVLLKSVLVAASTDERGRLNHRAGVIGTAKPYSSAILGRSRSIRGSLSRARSAALAWLHRVPGEGGALLEGLLTGHMGRIRGSMLEADFRAAGLSHLIAVSGSHLVVLGAVCSWALVRIRARRTTRAVVSIGLLGAYVVFSGLQASAVRAFIMSSIAVLCAQSSRRSDALAALGTTITVLVCVWPPAVFDVGLQLSALAAGGIVLFGRLAERWVSDALPRLARGLAPPVALTLVAQFVTAPVTIPVFGSISLIAPVANLLSMPMISAALTLGIVGLAVSALSADCGHFILMFAGAAANACARTAARMATVPRASVLLSGNAPKIGLMAGASCGLLWAVWPVSTPKLARVGVLGLALSLLIGFSVPGGEPSARLTVLDVGQGDAILVESMGHAMLVDTGPDESALRGALTRSGVGSLDWLVITHAHDDHDGGTRALSGAVTVAHIGTTGAHSAASLPPAECLRRAESHQLAAGDAFSIGALNVKVLWPPKGYEGPENDSSIVLLVEGEGCSALLTGDAEAVVLGELTTGGAVGDVDVLKVGHHGSRASVSEPVLRQLAPEVCLVSVGEGNRFGHPAESTLHTIADSGAKMYRTDLGGDLTVRFEEPTKVVMSPLDTLGDAMRH